MKLKSDKMDFSTVAILLVIGLCAGVLSGFVGVGGGIIIVPALVFFLGFTQHQAQGTSLAMMLPPIGILAVMNYYKSGNIDMKAALILCVTFVVGGYLGSKLSISLDQKLVKKVFAVIMMVAALRMLIK